MIRRADDNAVERVFLEVQALPSEERASFLDRCGEEPAVVAEVRALIRAVDRA